MISILIPVFNNDITSLVHGLFKQIDEITVEVEIIIVDDASTTNYASNAKISDLENVHYEILKENIGRSKIRNYLASLAKFDYLIFIDCDAKIVSKLFIKNYLNCIESDRSVACGGLLYEEKKPQNHKLFFRWYYGVNREFQGVNDRVKDPYKSFSSFNFLIKKNILKNISFNEDISTYGHEDTLFGIELKKQNIDIYHIDNPLLHDGLEDTLQFINKTNHSIKNLKYLVKYYSESYPLAESIKLIKYVKFAEKNRIAWLFRVLYSIAGNVFVKNLRSKHPSLYIFDLYKISYYFSL
ncbi:MAG: glycosyltransferase [Bacteroidales bacterium]|jgi:glycosyltransferase involved in cell wall biosynthesis|nr:glycosyltransferase [Bacteroidales bacterium]